MSIIPVSQARGLIEETLTKNVQGVVNALIQRVNSRIRKATSNVIEFFIDYDNFPGTRATVMELAHERVAEMVRKAGYGVEWEPVRGHEIDGSGYAGYNWTITIPDE